MNIRSSLALLLFVAFTGNAANAVPILSNAVAIQPVGVVASSSLGPAYPAAATIDQVSLSAHYISGITPASAIDGIDPVDDGLGWHGRLGVTQGSIVFDLGSLFMLDRVFVYWMNVGTSNNIANFSVDVTEDPGGVSFVTAATFGFPAGKKNRIDFAAPATGQFVRLHWTALQGSYPGLKEFIAAGVPASVPEPASIALLCIGLVALGVLPRGKRTTSTVRGVRST